jgi:hypothetical protein
MSLNYTDKENRIPVLICPRHPAWIDPGSNPGLRGGRPATNRLSHGTAFQNLRTWNQSEHEAIVSLVDTIQFKSSCTVFSPC